MCNLYTVRKSAAEVAAHFGVANPVASNAGEEAYPGTTGLVVREEGGQRIMQSMTWGFPLKLKTMKPGSKPIPVNNIADLEQRHVDWARAQAAMALFDSTDGVR